MATKVRKRANTSGKITPECEISIWSSIIWKPVALSVYQVKTLWTARAHRTHSKMLRKQQHHRTHRALHLNNLSTFIWVGRECNCIVGNSSQANCLIRNTEMDDSIGGSESITSLRMQWTVPTLWERVAGSPPNTIQVSLLWDHSSLRATTHIQRKLMFHEIACGHVPPKPRPRSNP